MKKNNKLISIKFVWIMLAVLSAGLAVLALTGRKTCEEVTLKHFKPIPATIVNNVHNSYDADFMLPVQATVDINVYSDDGRAVILPVGTLMLGMTVENTNKLYTDSGRIHIEWYRFIRPDGFEFEFNSNRPFSGAGQGRFGIPSADGKIPAGTRITVFPAQDLSAPCKMRRKVRNQGRFGDIIGVQVNPTRFVFDRAIYSPTRDDADIAPMKAWHDGTLTYIDFGNKVKSMKMRPVVSRLIKGGESPVGYRSDGKDGRYIIVDYVGDLTLRSGTKLTYIYQDGRPRPYISDSK